MARYYYGYDYEEAINNPPVNIQSVKQLEQYEEQYNFVIPAEEVDVEEDDNFFGDEEEE